MLQEIYDKNRKNNNCKLSIDELRLIYIDCFDLDDHDYYIATLIRENRNNYLDLVKLYGKEHVACNMNDINENTICFVGNLIIIDKLPTYNLKYIYGKLTYIPFEEIYNLENLEIIFGNVDFDGIYSANGLENLSIIAGNANFNYLTNAEDFISLKKVYGDFNLPNLESSKGLDNLEFVGSDAIFPRFMEANHLTSLKRVNGELLLNCITDSKGLEKLEYVENKVYFNNILDTSSLINLKSVGNIECRKLMDKNFYDRIKSVGRRIIFDTDSNDLKKGDVLCLKK